MEKVKMKKVKGYTFTDLPYRIILKILGRFYTFNYTKQFRESVLNNNDFYKNCSTFKELKDYFSLRTFYGYFKLDHFRTSFLLYKTVKLKEYIGSPNYHYKDNCTCVMDPDYKKLMLQNNHFIEMYNDVNIIDVFVFTGLWDLPKNVTRLVYIFEIIDHVTSYIPINENLKFLQLIFKSDRRYTSIDHLEHGLLNRCLKKKLFPKIIFENFMFGVWGMYYFIKYFNLEKYNWEIILKDCVFEKDLIEEEVSHLLHMDKISDIDYKKKILKMIDKFDPNLENLVFESGFKVKLINCE